MGLLASSGLFRGGLLPVVYRQPAVHAVHSVLDPVVYWPPHRPNVVYLLGTDRIVTLHINPYTVD